VIEAAIERALAHSTLRVPRSIDALAQKGYPVRDGIGARESGVSWLVGGTLDAAIQLQRSCREDRPS
jgi:hypothetical protein